MNGSRTESSPCIVPPSAVMPRLLPSFSRAAPRPTYPPCIVLPGKVIQTSFVP